MSKMLVRHPVVLSLWSLEVALSGLGLADPGWFVLVFLTSPFLAMVTLAVVRSRREIEPLRRGWSIAYRVASIGLAVSALAGILSAAARMVTTGESRHLENGPLAALFLITLIATWPTVTRPSPQRAAVPAVVVHLAWLPLVIMNALGNVHSASVGSNWDRAVSSVTLCGILALSSIMAMLALVGFAGESRIAPARAAVRV